jgi:hypothetical protein
MPLSFREQLILTIVDKGFFALILLVAGFWLNRILERYKSDLDWRKTLALARTEAYCQLWALTKSIGGTGKRTELNPAERRTASSVFSEWYWDKGNGLLISHETASALMDGWRLLDEPSVSDKEIRDHYSALRTRLKEETRVYTSSEAKAPVK